MTPLDLKPYKIFKCYGEYFTYNKDWQLFTLTPVGWVPSNKKLTLLPDDLDVEDEDIFGIEAVEYDDVDPEDTLTTDPEYPCGIFDFKVDEPFFHDNVVYKLVNTPEPCLYFVGFGGKPRRSVMRFILVNPDSANEFTKAIPIETKDATLYVKPYQIFTLQDTDYAHDDNGVLYRFLWSTTTDNPDVKVWRSMLVEGLDFTDHCMGEITIKDYIVPSEYISKIQVGTHKLDPYQVFKYYGISKYTYDLDCNLYYYNTIGNRWIPMSNYSFENNHAEPIAEYVPPEELMGFYEIRKGVRVTHLQVFIVNGVEYLFDDEGCLYYYTGSLWVKTYNQGIFTDPENDIHIHVETKLISPEELSESTLVPSPQPRQITPGNIVWFKGHLRASNIDGAMYYYDPEKQGWFYKPCDPPKSGVIYTDYYMDDYNPFGDDNAIVVTSTKMYKEIIEWVVDVLEKKKVSEPVENSTMEDSTEESTVNGSKTVNEVYSTCRDLQETVTQLRSQLNSLQKCTDLLDNQLRIVENSIIELIRLTDKS